MILERIVDKDPLHPLKYIGYCRAFGADDSEGYKNLLNVARFYLCKKTNTLWKDKIWESYLDEDILVEYFSYIFSENSEYRAEFEAIIGIGEAEDTYKWLDSMILENQKAQEEHENSLEDAITLSPSDLGN